MNKEMQLRYLYFLTKMYSGTDKWKACYEAWKRMTDAMDQEDYSKLIDQVTAFQKKYVIKRHRKQKKP